jgi:hypothetical protein
MLIYGDAVLRMQQEQPMMRRIAHLVANWSATTLMTKSSNNHIGIQKGTPEVRDRVHW